MPLRSTLFLLVWLSAAWFGSWEYNPNTATRMFAAISMVEDGDATIDEFATMTIDKAQFGRHIYLDKAPGMTLMAMPAVAVADAITGQHAAQFDKRIDDPGFTRFLRARVRLAAASGPALLTAIAAVLLFDMGLGLTRSAGAGVFAALGYALGTPIWGWSTTIFGHAVVAALYVIAVWSVWKAAQGRAWLGWIVGLALGWAVVVEYQAVLAGEAIAGWAVWRIWPQSNRWRFLLPAMVGGAAALLPIIGYNLFAFGTPFRFGYSGVTGFEGMHQGFFGLTTPRVSVLWEIVFGVRRGMLWVAPVLVFAPLGLAALWRRPGMRNAAVVAGAAAAIVLLVNAAYYYWDGGNATGPRHAMPMVGMLAIGLAPFWTGLERRNTRIAAAAVLAGSIAINAMIAAAETLAPPELRFPLWSGVILPFRHGDLRTIPSEYWDWSPWQGFALYVVLAVPTIVWLVHVAWVADARIAD